jgi:hypothetical protein
MENARRPQASLPGDCPPEASAAPSSRSIDLWRNLQARQSQAADHDRLWYGYEAAAEGLRTCGCPNITNDPENNPEYVVEMVEWVAAAYLWTAGMGLADHWPAALEESFAEQKERINEPYRDLIWEFAKELMAAPTSGRWGVIRGIVEVICRGRFAQVVYKVARGACNTLADIYRESLIPHARLVIDERRTGARVHGLHYYCDVIVASGDALAQKGQSPRAGAAPAEPPPRPEVPPPGEANKPKATRYIDDDTFVTLRRYLKDDPAELARVIERLRTLVEARPVPRPTSAKPVWNLAKRTLSYRGQTLKQYRRPAIGRFKVLNAFEEAGWPSAIDCGLDRPELRDQVLRDLRSDFRGTPLEIRGNGLGTGFTWGERTEVD